MAGILQSDTIAALITLALAIPAVALLITDQVRDTDTDDTDRY